jgi:hypothetical protein
MKPDRIGSKNSNPATKLSGRGTWLALTLFAASALFGGCTFVQSYKGATAQPGVSYYLPLRPVKLTYERSVDAACKVTDHLSAELMPLVADANSRYIAALKHHAFRSDVLAITTTAAGLLSSANGTATDQTGAVLVALVQSQAATAAGNGRNLALISNTLGVAKPPLQKCTVTPAKITQILDPKNDDQLARFQSELNQILGDGPYVLKCSSFIAQNSINVPYASRRDKKNASDSHTSAIDAPYVFAGLAYRRNQALVLSLLRGAATVADLTLELPQGAPIEMLKLDAAFGTVVTLNSVFENGMLISYTNNRPSEALAIASIPFTVAKAALEVPATLLKLKITNVDENNKLNTSLRAQICADEKLAAASAGRPVNAALCIAN